MEILEQALFMRLTEPGSRLTWIIDWLLEEVWNSERYQNLSPVEFLRGGEEKVNRFELPGYLLDSSDHYILWSGSRGSRFLLLASWRKGKAGPLSVERGAGSTIIDC